MMDTLPSFFNIHIPKTAGSTFKHMLKLLYGDDMLMVTDVPVFGGCEKHKDYQRYKVIQGHLLWFTYYHLPRITWVRNPVDRIASQYYSWLEKPDIMNPVCNKLYTENLSLREFCLAVPGMIYYMLGDDLARYKFIGITEEWKRDIDLFKDMFKIILPKTENIRVTKNKGHVSSKDRTWIEKHYSKDMELYYEALKIAR